MMKNSTRIAAFAAALMFGAAAIAPMAASAQGTTTTTPAPATPETTTTPAPAASAPAPSSGSTKPMKHHHMAMHHGHGGGGKLSAVQEALNKEGANLKVDGKWGSKTRAAVKSYQQAHGLKATGHLDKATKDALKVG
jgi:peptidoglycan hydrolase-like protein with peptidoglycan-binding domain